MPGEQGDIFADNWAYLKAELNWLDRVLMMAVARQRKDTKDIDRLAQSRADRATSHWWKGLISLEGTIAYDEHRKPSSQSSGKPSYQQQIEERIRATHQQGTVLGLPSLCDRLNLTVFEKNLVLMSLAPEVNRRYARIYRYLQGDERVSKTDLPTVDLVLRLLCRNDQEWRSARQRLMSSSPLVQHNLLKILPRQEDTLLNYPLKLDDSVVDFLLADQPSAESLDLLIQPLLSLASSPSLLTTIHPGVEWSQVVLPEPLIASLQWLSQSLQWQVQVDEQWGFGKSGHATGQIALLVGASGTGKTMAAQAIATDLDTPLAVLDLALIHASHYAQALQEIVTQAPSVLLVKSAHHWLRRSSQLADAAVSQFLAQRRIAGITLLSVSHQAAVQLRWQRQMSCITVPHPDRTARLVLWKQAFPPQLPLDSALDWSLLAAQPRLTGGDIAAIAHTAAIYLATSGDVALGLRHITQAFEQQGKAFKIQHLT
jgi:ATPase family associated with various cellular activities (AAA)